MSCSAALTLLNRPAGWVTLVMTALLLASPAQAQTDWALKSSAQLGVDAWHLSVDASDQPVRHFLLLANARTDWRYRDMAPWYTLQTQLRVGSQGEWVLRSRGNQSYGGAVDQLSYAHSISPALGWRAGILDYRATWCREYDLDNPWVREADSFCVGRFNNSATASAPALQVYAKVDVNEYQVQAVAGLYRPKALGWDRREFSNLFIADSATVLQNKKHALSVNAVNTATSTEWRLSWIGSDQRLFDSALVQINDAASFPATQLHYRQAVSTYFAGVSWQLAPRLRSRVTHFRSSLQAHCELLNPAAGEPCANQFYRASTVWELGYQLSPIDVLSLALAHYDLRQTEMLDVQVYEARSRNQSLAWRRDWGRGWFTSTQLTWTQGSVPYNNKPRQTPYIPGTSSAWGLGLRVGYQF